MSEIYPLYSATWEGESYDKDEVYQLLIIIKWKSNSKYSLEEGHKAYYVKLNGSTNNLGLNEDQLKEIYENHPVTGEPSEFDEAIECKRLLEGICRELEDGATSGSIIDINGNKVGQWSR